MTTNRMEVAAPPATVYRVLMDPYAYAEWVVGSKRVRGVDDDWPAPGSRFHHTVGGPGVDIDDSSKLIATEADRRVELEVRFRPVGVGIVTIMLEPIGSDRTRVTMTEHPKEGAVRHWWSPPLQAITYARNAYALRRLARISARRDAR